MEEKEVTQEQEVSEELFFKCGNCAWWLVPDVLKRRDKGICTANPPMPILIPNQSKLAMGNQTLDLRPEMLRPFCMVDDPMCRLYAPNKEMQEKLAKPEKHPCGGKCSEGCCG